MNNQLKDSGVDWIGKVPVSWEIVKFKTIMRKKKEICSRYENQNILSLTMNGVIVRDLINPKGKMPATFDGYQKVEKNNLLLCLFDIDVTPRCVGLIKDSGLTSPAYSQYVVDKKGNPRFYEYFLTYLDNNKVLLHLTKSLRNTLTDDDFGVVKTVLPSLNEQEKIADFLDDKMEQINSILIDTKQSIVELKNYKKALITEVVTKGVNIDIEMKDSGIEWIGDIPDHWEVTKMKHEIYIRARLGWKGLKADEYVENGFAFLSTPNIKDENIDFTNVNFITKERYDESPEIKLSQNDVLLTKDGSTLGTVNVVRFLEKESTVNSSIAVLTPSSKMSGVFLYYFIKSDYIQNLIKQKKDGMGVPHLFQRDIREFPLLMPSLKEQQQIISFLDEKCAHIDSLVNQKERILTELESYKKSFIYEYVTGKKEVL